MSHLRLVLAAVALALALPSAASAQEPPPPDERAAAQAFADAGVRFSQAVEGPDELSDRPYRKCRPLVRSVPEDKQLELAYLQILTGFRLVADRLREPLRQMRTDLANAQTRDPVLLSGRAAWRQAGRAMAALPAAEDPCAQLRAWRRAGFPRSVSRETLKEISPAIAAFGEEYTRKVRAASRRLVELGVPKKRAKAFEGDI